MANTPKSIIFAGTPEFAVPTLKSLINDNAFDVKLVISQPDKPVGRKQEIHPTPVKQAALEAGISILQPQDINKEYPNIDHDFLVVVAYGQILKEHILSAPTIAPVNLHASLLPRWRGASPMQSAIIHGDTETGITIQRMVKELDAGPILAQQSMPLQENETIETLHDTLAAMGAALLTSTLKKPLSETPQVASEVRTCHKLSKELGTIDPSTMKAVDLDRHVRALVPWPGVRVSINGEDVKLIKVSLTEKKNSVPLRCCDTDIFLVTVQPAGKKPMPANDWKHGRQ